MLSNLIDHEWTMYQILQQDSGEFGELYGAIISKNNNNKPPSLIHRLAFWRTLTHSDK
jgi:hypothetical protein